MKVVILAGGMGTRLAEETGIRPKPMVEIGGKPILWHIMKIYSHWGFNDFIICLGYKGYMIKEYFINYYYHNSDITVELDSNRIHVHNSNSESFKVTLVDTGLTTNTAGRIKKIRPHVDGQTFMLTYGDGVSDVNIPQLIDFHKKNKKVLTLTAIQNPGRFGNLIMNESGHVSAFEEKPKGDGNWINGGFFVCEPKVFDYLSGDMENIQWEREPMRKITADGQLTAYKHHGFWKCMDALRDKQELENMWNSGNAKWKMWK
jgi:glucose-1-phosphate cytidylyltransferase